MPSRPRRFKFTRTDSVGAPAAEDDAEFLKNCFVETDDIALIQQPSDRRIIVLGRTGAGKTALLNELRTRDPQRVISINPENLALTYIAGSSALNFFAELGVNLDPFFKLLWRHVFTVEILTLFFDQFPYAPETPSIFDKLRAQFAGSSKEETELRQAVKYLESWGREFWTDTEYRVREITVGIEKELKNSLKATLGTDLIGAGAEQGKVEKLTEEQKIEVRRRAQEVVSKAQVKDLHQVFSLLDKVLSDKQKVYYITVDGLDTNWVEESLRYRLIMALIQTAREFIPVKHAKVLISLRRDLMERVFRLTRESGFQEEKYLGLCLPLAWTKDEILAILDRRVAAMVRRRYTKQKVGYADLLPQRFRGVPLDDYIFSIARLPRDAVAFFNTCILIGVGDERLSEGELARASAEYSRTRLRALADEWQADYPGLVEFSEMLEGRPPSFKIGKLTEADVYEFCFSMVDRFPQGKGQLHAAAKSVFDGLMSEQEFRVLAALVFYRIGMVGIKTGADTSASWSDDTEMAVTRRQINEDSSIVIAPKYAAAVGVSPG